MKEWSQLLGIGSAGTLVVLLLIRFWAVFPGLFAFIHKNAELKADLEQKMWERLKGQWQDEMELNKEQRKALELLQNDLKSLRGRYEEVRLKAELAEDEAHAARTEADHCELRYKQLADWSQLVYQELKRCEYPHEMKPLPPHVAGSDSDR